MNLTEWCNKSLERNKADFAELHAQVGALQPFKTAASIPRLLRDGRPHRARALIHYAMYFFAGNGNMKIAVTCACAATDVDHYAPLFEAAMETFVPY